MSDKKQDATPAVAEAKKTKRDGLVKGHIRRKLKAIGGKDGAVFERNANRVIANNR